MDLRTNYQKAMFFPGKKKNNNKVLQRIALPSLGDTTMVFPPDHPCVKPPWLNGKTWKNNVWHIWKLTIPFSGNRCQKLETRWNPDSFFPFFSTSQIIPAFDHGIGPWAPAATDFGSSLNPPRSIRRLGGTWDRDRMGLVKTLYPLWTAKYLVNGL